MAWSSTKCLAVAPPARALWPAGYPLRRLRPAIKMVASRGFRVNAVYPDGTLGAMPDLKGNEYTNLFCMLTESNRPSAYRCPRTRLTVVVQESGKC